MYKHFLFILFFLLSFLVHASINSTHYLTEDKVIYGEDNTLYAGEYNDQRFVEASKAVAVMIPVDQMIDFGSFYELVRKTTYVDNYPLCKNEINYRGRVHSICSGFLVDNDVLVTASHCIPDQLACQNGYKWVFGFSKENMASNEPIFVPKRDVFSCEKILESEYNLSANVQKDYAVIKLSRQVETIVPLAFRKEGKINDDDELVLIGYPVGRPQIIADHGQIRDNTFFYFFRTNLDAFIGNSGAPVLNYSTGLVEGIFLSGERDYVFNSVRQCWNIKRCQGVECRGEDVFRITGIDYIAPNKRSWLSRLLPEF